MVEPVRQLPADDHTLEVPIGALPEVPETKYQTENDDDIYQLDFEKPELIALLSLSGHIPQDLDEVSVQLEKLEHDNEWEIDQDRLWMEYRDKFKRKQNTAEVKLNETEVEESNMILDWWTPKAFKSVLRDDPRYEETFGRDYYAATPVSLTDDTHAVTDIPDDARPGDIIVANIRGDTTKKPELESLTSRDENPEMPAGKYLKTLESAEDLYESITEQRNDQRVLQTGANELVMEDEYGVTDEALLMAARSEACKPGQVELFFNPETEEFPVERRARAEGRLEEIDPEIDRETERILMYLASENMTGAARAREKDDSYRSQEYVNMRGKAYTGKNVGKGEFIVDGLGESGSEIIARLETE